MTVDNISNTGLEILLVEDNQDHAELAQHALSMAVKNRINLVQDGQEAMDYLLHKSQYAPPKDPAIPGLILLDLRLPKIDGIKVLELIKAQPHLRSIPICMLTTSANKDDIQDCYAKGANSYVTKPVQYNEFIEKVKELGRFWFSTNLLPTRLMIPGGGS